MIPNYYYNPYCPGGVMVIPGPCPCMTVITDDLLVVNGTYINVITGMRLNVGPQISGNDFINIDGSFFEDIDGSIVNYQ